MKKGILGLISFYQQYISSQTAPSCRFHPTCSTYAYEAISAFGVVKGGVLSLKRMAKCHPFHRAKTMVVDPVPEVFTWKKANTKGNKEDKNT